MNLGIGPGKTREDHRGVADQLYAFYAQGGNSAASSDRGEEGLAESDRRFRRFADASSGSSSAGKTGENHRGDARGGWKLLRLLPKDQLTRIRADHVAKRYGRRRRRREDGGMTDRPPAQQDEPAAPERSGTGGPRGAGTPPEQGEALARELFAIAEQAVATRGGVLGNDPEGGVGPCGLPRVRRAGRRGVGGVRGPARDPRRDLRAQLLGDPGPEIRWQGIVRSATRAGTPSPASRARPGGGREFEKTLEAVLEWSRSRPVQEDRRGDREIDPADQRAERGDPPGAARRMRTILLALEERERENVFRMKRFKGRKR